jgi:hypothetical protein
MSGAGRRGALARRRQMNPNSRFQRIYVLHMKKNGSEEVIKLVELRSHIEVAILWAFLARVLSKADYRLANMQFTSRKKF